MCYGGKGGRVMFESEASLTQLIEAAYYAMRALERRLGPDELESKPIMAGLASEPGPEERNLAREWIEKIERQEHRPINKLDNETIQRYLGELSDTVQKRVHLEVKPDLKRGQQLLEKLWATV
jgi:hypothetical protein